MNLNTYFKNHPELDQNDRWRILCFRFVGRQRALERMKDTPLMPDIILTKKEKEMIQSAYEEMREACLDDKEYMEGWEHIT